MKITFLKETSKTENRIALTPDVVAKYVALGTSVVIEKNAGVKASFSDNDYKTAGATIAATAKDAIQKADIIVKTNAPTLKEAEHFKKGQVIIANMDIYNNEKLVQALTKKSVSVIALELMPRITRAQSMDILSSQNNIAGYKAVIRAAEEFSRSFPMMMTAAGTVPPVKLLVMGVGVSGLQAIATAKRLGAVVSASDVRPATKEQVESLGANFIAVEDEEFLQAQTAGGYAKEMSSAYKEKQAALLREVIAKQDIVITTALIPGKPAPKLISDDMLESMKTGSVIIDLACANGGNCEGAKLGASVLKHGVKIIDGSHLASDVPQTTSLLLAKNVLAFISQFVDEASKAFKLDIKDEIMKEVLVSNQGKISKSMKAMWG